MKEIKIFNANKELLDMKLVFSFTCQESGKTYVVLHSSEDVFEKNSRYANLDILEIIKEAGNTIYVSDIPDDDCNIVKKCLQFKVFAKMNK